MHNYIWFGKYTTEVNFVKVKIKMHVLTFFQHPRLTYDLLKLVIYPFKKSIYFFHLKLTCKSPEI